MRGDGTETDARETLKELAAAIESHFGSDLLGLYLFGSLAAGGFYPGKSDIDLMAIIGAGVEEGPQLEDLRSLHDTFVSERPAWVERVEVAYVERGVLQTFGERPRGRIADVCPGERLRIRDAGAEFTLDWHGVTTLGETIFGPPPLDLGPEVSLSAYLHAVEELLKEWPTTVREPWVAYVPAHQGYVVMTLCRALYALATGKQATKEEAAAWAAARYPEWSQFISEAHATYRADVRDSHRALISFTDYAVAQADDPTASKSIGMGQRSGMTPEGRVPLRQLRVWLDHLRNDPAVLADLAVADEAEAFVRRESAVIEKARRNGTCILWITLHPPAAKNRDEIQRTCERRSGDTVTPVPLAYEVARDPPVRQNREAFLVRGAVLDPRHFAGRAELAPAQAVVPVEHEGCMSRACPDASQLPLTLRRLRASSVFVEPHAPAAPEDPVVVLHQRGKRRPSRLVKGSDDVLGQHGRA
jgi:predicted nucleotidyltransferase